MVKGKRKFWNVEVRRKYALRPLETFLRRIQKLPIDFPE